MDALTDRIEEPTQLCAVLAIFFHFLLQGGQGIRRRTQFEHKVRTNGKKFFTFIVGKRVESIVANPGDIGGAGRTTRQDKSGRGSKDLVGVIALGLNFERRGQLAATPSTTCAFWGPNNDVSVRGTLDLQIAINAAELEELFIVHVDCPAGMDDHSLGFN